MSARFSLRAREAAAVLPIGINWVVHRARDGGWVAATAAGEHRVEGKGMTVGAAFAALAAAIPRADPKASASS